MRPIVVLASIFVCFSAGLAECTDLDSVKVGGVHVTLGMSRVEVEEGLPPDMILREARDIVPKGISYYEVHGRKSFLARDDSPRTALAWITFEDDQVTQVSRTLRTVEGGTSHDSVGMLVSGIYTVFGHQEMPLIIEAGSHSFEGGTFEYFEARAGHKRVILRSSPGVTQITEELGRRDIPVTR